ncbi:hypothetical protein E2I00_014746 [Balaenoptera physalus]|uniref:VWFA domain-containing protein n=1 Tax=Balaenoptera physalus TaxID=9770 RepID=A0A643BNC7_BALPH|nr:hypothetical protein E2I00_014746 [Balaenoptera physalus]
MLQGSNTPLVRLNNNGYEGIVIAIDPADYRRLKAVKCAELSDNFGLTATEKRFFFKNVSILIPENWKNKSQYKRPKHESYKHVDVLVTPPTLPGRDEIYTKQFTACEEKGEYIHFTPDFVLGKKQNEFGPSGRVCVHEWAHLLWGVFDEYNDDEPFYSAKSKKIDATSHDYLNCLKLLQACKENSCVTNRCKTDSKTKLYEKDCQFFPDKYQTEKTSIMFMQGIDSISIPIITLDCIFTIKGPLIISLNSVMKKTIIEKLQAYKIKCAISEAHTVPMVAPPPPPVFSLLRISERTVCLVLDKSENMKVSFMGKFGQVLGGDTTDQSSDEARRKGSNRLNRMNQAAKHFLLQTVENGSWVGIVDFGSTSHIKRKLIQIISNKERRKLLESLPTEASGGTSICSGTESAFQVIREIYPQIDGSEIILVAAGEDKNVRNCTDKVKQSEAIIHFIALGPHADQAVIEMSNVTDQNKTLKLFVSHFLIWNVKPYDISELKLLGLIMTFSAFEMIKKTTLQKTEIFVKAMMFEGNGWMNATVIIDSTVGKDTFFLVTWDKQPPVISLWDPNGTSMESFTVDKDSKMAYFSIPGTARIKAKKKGIFQDLYFPPETTPGGCLDLHSSSKSKPRNINYNTKFSGSKFFCASNHEILQGYIPFLGANVTAFIESNNGNTKVMELLDNGAGADSFKNDGVYSRYFTTYKENDKYSL